MLAFSAIFMPAAGHDPNRMKTFQGVEGIRIFGVRVIIGKLGANSSEIGFRAWSTALGREAVHHLGHGGVQRLELRCARHHVSLAERLGLGFRGSYGPTLSTARPKRRNGTVKPTLNLEHSIQPNFGGRDAVCLLHNTVVEGMEVLQDVAM